MSVYPEYLTSISGEWIEPYVWVFTLGDFEVYNRSDLPTGYEICVNINPSSPDYNTWFDYGDQKPHIIQDDGTTVRLRSNNVSNFFTFTKPTVASWIPVTNDFLNVSLTYDNATNKLSWIIPASYPSTSDPLIQAHRTDYLLVNTSAYVVIDVYLTHTQGTPTIGSSDNTIAAGNWVIKRVISAPNASTSVNVQLIVTQAEIDAYNAAVQAAADAAAALISDAAADAAAAAAAAAAAQAALDAANNAANTPPNTPRSRRGNLNFW